MNAKISHSQRPTIHLANYDGTISYRKNMCTLRLNFSIHEVSVSHYIALAMEKIFFHREENFTVH